VVERKLRCSAIFLILGGLLLSACGGGSGGGGVDAETSTSRYFERIRHNAGLERAFLNLMPKGGDIHNHLSGAVLAESYIQWAAELNDCVCVNQTCGASDTQYTIKVPAQSPQACDPAAGLATVAQSIQDPNFYNAMIDALSMRNFIPGAESGHNHFFATFAKFGAISGVKTGPMLAQVASVWHAGNVKYLELMLSLAGGGGARRILSGMTWDPTQMQQLFTYLINHPAFAGYLSQGTADLNNAEAQMRSALGCGSDQADPACKDETIRYIYQVTRTQAPILVFATAVYAFELAAADHRVVGVNLVAPEDDPVALSDYLTQMQIFDFLSQAVPGVKISLHAGELTPEFAPLADLRFHIRAAVETGQASRIGHGVDIQYEDAWPQLMSEMAQEQRLVEICLTSNDYILQVSGPEHAFETYRSYGVPLTLATDDAGISRIDLTHEYQRAADSYQLHYVDLKDLARNSLEYDFLPGKSLWKSTVPFIRTDECRHDSPRARRISPPCQNLLDTSEHARQQWQLEADFASFESSIARAHPAATFAQANLR
jgi:adenosine deaminase